MEYLVGMLVPISGFSMIVLIVYFVSKYKSQTRLAIIEKGGNIEFPKKKMRYLEIGFAIIGFGIGLAIAAFTSTIPMPEESMILSNFAFPLIFGGLGLVSAYFIRRKLEKDNK